MAYGTLVHILERQVGFSPRQFFAAAIAHILDGQLPLARFHAAGHLCEGRRVTEGQVAREVDAMSDYDLNPFLQCMLACATPAQALRIHASYMQRSTYIRVPTHLALAGGGFRIHTRRVPAELTDVSICRDSHLAAMNMIATRIQRGAVPPPPTLGLLVDRLQPGLPAVADACAALDAEPGMSVTRLAAETGCRLRTLQRALARAGVTGENLRRAAMLLRATSQLRSRRTLTEIAHDAGYSDLAHMTRSFVTSCGVTPTGLRAGLHARPGS